MWKYELIALILSISTHLSPFVKFTTDAGNIAPWRAQHAAAIPVMSVPGRAPAFAAASAL